MAEKYVVFKKEFWEAAKDFDLALADTEKRAVPDAVVIRLQDVFAGHALASYANGIGLVRHILQQVQAGELDLDETVVQLEDPADYFHEMSEEAIANHTSKKVPD